MSPTIDGRDEASKIADVCWRHRSSAICHEAAAGPGCGSAISAWFAIGQSCRRVPSLLIVALCLVVMSAVFALHLHADEPPPSILTAEETDWLRQNSDKLKLVFNIEFPPVEFISARGTFVGIGADVIALLEKRLGVVFPKIPSDDWNKHLAALKSGDCAIAPTIVRTTDRERFAFFTPPYATVPVVIIGTKKLRDSLTLDDFADKRIAVVSGYATEDYLRDRGDGRFTTIPVADVLEGLRTVSFGQADAYVENLAVAAYYIDKEGIPNLKVVGSTDYAFAWSIGVSRKYPLLFSAIQKTFNTVPESEFEAIRNHWISLKVPGGMSPETVLLIRLTAVFTLMLLMGLAGISYFLKRKLDEKVAHLKQSQQSLLDQTNLLQLATEATQAGIWDFNPSTGKRFLSPQWFRMLDYPENGREVGLSDFKKMVHPDDFAVTLQALENCMQTGGKELFEAELRLRRADGSWCWVLSKGRVTERDPKGFPTRITGLDVNIHNIKDALERMAQSEAKFRAVFDHAPYAISINGLDGRYIDVNPALIKSRNISKDEFLKRKALDFAMVSAEEEARIIETLLATGSVSDMEATLRKPDGTRAYALYSSALVEIQGEKQVLSMVVDVTKQKEAEKALRESEERFRSLFQMAPLPLVEITRDGRVLAFNNRFQKVLGYSLEDIPTIEHWWENAYPEQEYRQWVMSVWREAIERAERSGADVQSGEFRVTCKNGTVRTMIVGASIIGNGLLASFFDITERKWAETEREKLQSQLLQAQKLEAVGVLAGGVAHDFNNMLGAIIGYAELTMDSMEADNPFRMNLLGILEAAQRSAALTRQLLAFARKQKITPIVFDLNESVETMLKMLRRLIGENIELAWLPAGVDCKVKMDPSQLDQVLANLCVNARDAIADVGKVTIKTGIVHFDESDVESTVERPPGDYVRLSISDDGCGMDEETANHAFEPFFTTKGVGQGTGLGLATIYGIVRQNEGFIDLTSKPGTGTTFDIYIPRHEEDGIEAASETVADIPRSRGETILIVEDESTIREMGLMMLQRLGYHAVSAATPNEAIQLVGNYSGDIHLCVTDVVMPEMNGRELADRLTSIRPDMKCLFMSGYTEDAIVHRGVLDQGIDFMQKPFSLTDLAVNIRAALDSA